METLFTLFIVASVALVLPTTTRTSRPRAMEERGVRAERVEQVETPVQEALVVTQAREVLAAPGRSKPTSPWLVPSSMTCPNLCLVSSKEISPNP